MLVITLLWVAWRVSRESKQSADALRASRLLEQAQGLRNLVSSSLEHSLLLALEAMKVAAQICIYTNDQITVESL